MSVSHSQTIVVGATILIGYAATKLASVGFAAGESRRFDSTVSNVSVPEFAAARQPQVAVGPTGNAFVTFGMGDAVYFAATIDGDRAFCRPVKVSDVGKLALGKRRGPRVAVGGDTVTITAVVGERGGGKDGDVFAWRTAEGGRKWAGPVKVNRIPGSAREGLHDLAASGDGRLFCVWIDLRNGRSQVFGASSADGGATWGQDRPIYESPTGVCPCCQPSACYDAKGRLHALWRNNVADNRDMYLLSSTDGGQTWDSPRKLGQGTWHLRACPMDGGGFAADADGLVHTIWRRQQTLFRCVDGQPEKAVGNGEQGRAARGPGGVYMTWLAQRPGALMLLRPDADKPVRLADHAIDPVIAASPFGRGPVVVAWEEADAAGGPIRMQTVTP
jgi:hypothetical protein